MPAISAASVKVGKFIVLSTNLSFKSGVLFLPLQRCQPLGIAFIAQCQ